MAGSKTWVKGMVDNLEAKLGPGLAEEIILGLQKVPGANASARQTLEMLLEEIRDRQRKR